MLATSRTRSGHPTLSSAVRPSRSRTLTGVLIVGAVEAALVALFLLGWTTAVPAPDAPLAAPTPVASPAG